MATNLNQAANESANRQHNVGDLKKLIRDCATQMQEIDDERKELNERAGEIRQRLKDSGVQVKAFDYARRLLKMEEEARNSYIDDLRVNFEALEIGGQGILFPEVAGTA